MLVKSYGLHSFQHVPINCLIVQVTEGALVGGSIFPGHERIAHTTAICVARGKSVRRLSNNK